MPEPLTRSPGSGSGGGGTAATTTFTPAGTVAADDVQEAIEEVSGDVEAHVADTTAAHAAASISADSTTLVGTGTTVQAVFEELDDAIVALAAPAYVVTTATGTLAAEVLNLTTATFPVLGDLTTGTGAGRWTNDTGRTLTFFAARARVGTAPTGQTIICDVNVGGTTIFGAGTKVVIADGGTTVKQTTFSTTTIADGGELTVDVDQVGSGAHGGNLVVTVWMSG